MSERKPIQIIILKSNTKYLLRLNKVQRVKLKRNIKVKRNLAR